MASKYNRFKGIKKRRSRRFLVINRRSAETSRLHAVRQAYKDPHRGGLKPADFDLWFDVESYANELGELVETDTGVFPDTNAIDMSIYNPACCSYSGLFDFFYETISYFSDKPFRPYCERIFKSFEEFIKFCEYFLTRPNVHITSGVRREIGIYTEMQEAK